MPSHGPTEPPEDSGWENEYDKIMETPEGVAMLRGLFRDPHGVSVLTYAAFDALYNVETDDDPLQAFVQMVYDRGIAHGYGNAQADASMAALADELAEQDRILGLEP